jgi:hypothetical protein
VQRSIEMSLRSIFTDAKRGDDVLAQDSQAIDLGSPGFAGNNNEKDGGSGGGGGGCFISAMNQ